MRAPLSLSETKSGHIGGATRPGLARTELRPTVWMARDIGASRYDSIFDAWIRQAASGARQNLHKMIVVDLLDKGGHVCARWRFRNAWPSKFRAAPVSVGGNTAAVELVTIEHEGFKRDADVATPAIGGERVGTRRSRPFGKSKMGA